MSTPKKIIPRGLCQCGCGTATPIHTTSDAIKGYRRGDPKRFINGHQRFIRPDLDNALPFKIDGVYCRLIPLTLGMYAIVDAADYEVLMQWKWCAWRSPDGSHYAKRGGSRKGIARQIMMHRQILNLVPGDGMIGDHIDCMSTLDNRRKNLRVADYSQSSANQRRKKDNSSGFKGVSRGRRYKSGWKATIYWRNTRIPLGTFETKEAAHEAYCEAAKKYHGEFARTN
jgi:hypothetical protein